jgi:dihydroneopterin aldolase
MAESRIVLTGIRALGRHGANPGERDQPQEFVVDLDVLVSVGGDALEATADYRTLAAAARQAVTEWSFVLLESLADAVAIAVSECEGVLSATAVVHKPQAARSMGLDGVAATATRP